MDELTANIWFVLVGIILLGIALTRTFLQKLPLTTSILYLVVGFLLGPYVAGLILFDPVQGQAVLERITEVAVIISLFTAGLKLRIPLTDRKWLLPVRL